MEGVPRGTPEGGGVSYYVEANKKTRASGLFLFTAKSGLPSHRG